MSNVLTPAHAPPTPVSFLPSMGVIGLLMLVFIIAVMLILIARRRNLPAFGSIKSRSRGLFSSGGVLTVDKTGLNTEWHALGILVKESSTEIVHLVKLTPTNDVWTLLEDPSTILGLTEEHFITHIDGIPTAVLIGMFAGYVPVSSKEAAHSFIKFSPAVVCVEKGKSIDENGNEVESTTVLDPYSTQSVILNALKHGGLDSNITCEVYGTVSEALNVAPSATGLISINDSLALIPVSKTALRSTELEIGLDRMNALSASNMVTILRKLNALINAQVQKARAQNMRILYIGLAITMILAIILTLMHHI